MSIKRAIAAASVVVMMILLSAPAHSSDADTFGSAFQSATSVWLKNEDGGTYMYIAGAAHLTNLENQRSRSIAFVDKSKCAVAETKDIKVIACSSRAKAKKIDPDSFVFDPLLDNASLRFDGNRVKWVGQDVPQPVVFPAADPPNWAFVGATLDRWAIASGRVLGTEFKGRKWTDFGYLTEGAFAGVFLAEGSSEVRMDSDGRVHYEINFEV